MRNRIKTATPAIQQHIEEKVEDVKVEDGNVTIEPPAEDEYDDSWIDSLTSAIPQQAAQGETHLPPPETQTP